MSNWPWFVLGFAVMFGLVSLVDWIRGAPPAYPSTPQDKPLPPTGPFCLKRAPVQRRTLPERPEPRRRFHANTFRWADANKRWPSARKQR